MAGPSEECLDAIRAVEGNQKGCREDKGSLSCGFFQIKEAFYEDCKNKSDGKSWKECADDPQCARQCAKDYGKKYGEFCTKGRTPTCEDYAKIHNGGPTGCRKSGNVDKYYSQVKSHLDKHN